MKRALLLAAVAFTVHAETLREMGLDCRNPKKSFFARAGTCVIDSFTLSDFPHLTVHSFPPGGSFGFGVAYSPPIRNAGLSERTLTMSAGVSIRGFWYANTKLTLLRNGASTGEQFGLHLYGDYQDLKRLSYYGLGPNTHLSDLTQFHEKLGTFGLDVQQPLNNYFSGGGAIEGIVPSVGPGTRLTVVHYLGFLRFHGDVPDLRQTFEDKISFGYYQDAGGTTSFRRFRAEVKHDFFPFGARRPRRDRVLSIRGIVSLSDTGANHTIPFFMQETLGGGGLDGEATLRSFADYRFRAPNLTVIETEYTHRPWGNRSAPPVPGSRSLLKGLLYSTALFAFYDTGQVALRRDDLDIGKMRHSAGGGIAIAVGGIFQAKLFVGFGGGEGHHTYWTLPKF